jgi:hypothetical protein
MTADHKIRRLLAGFFLLLFAFCATPKRFLHDILANHRDAQTIADFPVEQIGSSGFHCHVDDLVVVAPFLPEIQSAAPIIFSTSPVHFSEPLSLFKIRYLAHADGRGPPAIFCS